MNSRNNYVDPSCSEEQLALKEKGKASEEPKLTPDNPTTKMAVDIVIIALTIVAVTWDLALFIGEKFSDLVGSNWCQVAFLGVVVIYLVGWRNKKDQIQAAATICKWVVLPLAIIMLFVNSLWPNTTLKGLKVKWQQHKAAQAQAAAARQRSRPEPDYKIYHPGDVFYFKGKAGEYSDHWINPVYGTRSRFQVKEGEFAVVTRSGKRFKMGHYPKYLTEDYKIYAVTDCDMRILFE